MLRANWPSQSSPPPPFKIHTHFKKVPLKLQGLLKLKHFDSQATNFGPVLPNSHKRLRNFYHSIGEIKIVLFLRLVLKQHDELKACSKYIAVAYLLKALRSFTVKLFCQGQGDMGEERHW